VRSKPLQKFLKLMWQNPLGGFGLLVITLLFLVGIFGPGMSLTLPGGTTVFELPRLAPHRESDLGVGQAKEDPSLARPFGTDDLGRDMFSRVIFGARISLLVGFGAVLIGTSIGMVIGLASGYFGGWIDNAIQRTVDAIIAFPPLIALLIIIRILGPNLQNVILVIALFIIFRIRHGSMGTFEILRSFAKISLCASIMGVACWLGLRYTSFTADSAFLVQLLVFAALIIGATALYLALAWVFRCHEIEEVYGIATRRRGLDAGYSES